MFKFLSCPEDIQLFFILTTLLLGICLLFYIKFKSNLKKKLLNFNTQLAQKDQELNKLKAASQNILSPFIPETSRSIIVSIDVHGKITDVNEYATEVFGYKKDEMVGKEAIGTIYPTLPKKTNPSLITRIFNNPKLYVEYESENVKKSGERFWISWTNRIIYDDAGKAIEMRSVGFDITKRKRLEEELKYLASIDPLTGVLNRQALLETGNHELKRAERYKRKMSVLIMRLDYFRGPDDSRNFSDNIIQQVIAIVRKTVRDSDSIGRIGDVEFAIILPETSATNARVVASRIKDNIQEENLRDKGHFFVTTTFGISEFKSSSDTIDSLISSAFNNTQDLEKGKKVSQKKGL